MLRRWLSIMLVGSLTCALAVTPSASVIANSKAEKDTKRTEKVKAGIIKLGTGKDARVSVKLKDKSQRSGFINEIGPESFVVVDAMGANTTIAYSEVTQVQGHNLSKGAKIAIGVGIVVGVIIVLVIVRGAFCDGC